MNVNALALKNKFFIREGRENFWKKEYVCVFFREDERNIYRHRPPYALMQQ